MIRLYRFLRPFWPVLCGTVVLIFLQSLASLYLPSLMAQIVDNGIARNDTTYILDQGKLMLLVAIAGMLCAVAAAFLASRVAAGFGRDVRARLFARVETFSLHEFDQVRHRDPDYAHHQRRHPGTDGHAGHAAHDGDGADHGDRRHLYGVPSGSAVDAGAGRRASLCWSWPSS